MGFANVYDYAAGKANWIAMSMPTEHHDTRPRIEQVARRDAPTCGVRDAVGDVRARIPEGWNICVVLNADRIVLGMADLSREFKADQAIEEIMRPAPLTFRPGVTVED